MSQHSEAITSRLTTKSQTVIPKPVRETLGVGPGDTVVYRITPDGVILERAPEEDDPFAVFTEWASAEDDAAYRDL